MGVKDIFTIQSTGKLCVDEGITISGNSGQSLVINKHVRILDSNYVLTEETCEVHPDELVPHLLWNGSDYVPPE